MLRHGRHVEAMAHAEAAAARALRSSSVRCRSQAAPPTSRRARSDALALYERAEASGSHPSRSVRDTKWGQLVCLIDLEIPARSTHLLELSQGVGFGDPRELVRAAGHGLYLQLRQGALDLDDADVAIEVLPAVSDPARRVVVPKRLRECTSARRTLRGRSRCCCICSTIRRAVPALISPFRTRSARPRWRTRVREMAQRPRRRRARLLALSRASRDVHAELLSCSVLLRLYLQQGRFTEALGLELGSMRGALKRLLSARRCARVRSCLPARAVRPKRANLSTRCAPQPLARRAR